MSPREFLNHPVLNVVLYNNIGKGEYDAIKKSYEKKSMSLSDYEDITSSLNMTFTSSDILPEVDAVERTKQSVAAKNVIDFDMLIASIPKDILNEKAFNKRTRELIENLAFVYNLDTIEFSEIIKNVINERGFIVADELRKLARNYYTYHNNGKLPTLVYKEDKHVQKMFDDVFLLNYLVLNSLGGNDDKTFKKEQNREAIETLTNNMITKIVEINSDLPVEDIEKIIGDKIAVIKSKKEASVAEVSNKLNSKMQSLISKIITFDFR